MTAVAQATERLPNLFRCRAYPIGSAEVNGALVLAVLGRKRGKIRSGDRCPRRRSLLSLRSSKWLHQQGAQKLLSGEADLARKRHGECLSKTYINNHTKFQWRCAEGHIWQVTAKVDPITADFCYTRWLGDRKGIELETKVWYKTIVDRRPALIKWVKFFHSINHDVDIYAYANNHYAGHGPATVVLFKELWDKQTI
jgi:uncharacterized protein YecE (DUF72 family)